MNMNAQEKLAAIEQHAAKALIECRRIHGDNVNWAIEQHAAKALIEIRELMVELAVTDPQNTPPAVSLFAAKARMRQLQSTRPGSGYVSPLDERADYSGWDDAA
jgi:hypothetical protein